MRVIGVSGAGRLVNSTHVLLVLPVSSPAASSVLLIETRTVTAMQRRTHVAHTPTQPVGTRSTSTSRDDRSPTGHNGSVRIVVRTMEKQAGAARRHLRRVD
jgi:hypothetical protein